MNLQEILKGYKLGTPQTVANMRVLPILTDTPFTKISGMENVYLKRDMAYQTLLMATKTEVIAVIPQGIMYITSEQAQDRAIPSAHIIKTQLKVNADCLQPSQGGYLASQKKDREYGILPRSLRLVALEVRADDNYDSIWGAIEKFMKEVGMTGRELKNFFLKYKEELETFVAQFEPVDKQVGAVFIVNDVVLGIEVMPNYDIWQEMWRPIVRDCYGSEAITFQKKGLFLPSAQFLLKKGEVEDISDLESEVERVRNEERAMTTQLVTDLVSTDFEQEVEEELEDFTLYTLTSERLTGQGATHGPERFIYVSLMTPEKKLRAGRARRFDARWHEGGPYSQDRDFTF